MAHATDDLSVELHYGCDLVQSDVLLRLQDVLATCAPTMSADLGVHAYERDRDRLVVALGERTSLRDAVLARGTQRGATYDALAAASPPPVQQRRSGSALLRGRGAGARGRYVTVQFDSMVPAKPIGDSWLWSNTVRCKVSTARVEGTERAGWAERFASELSRHPDFLWGAGYLLEEFAASNLDDTAGLCALGRDVRRHLPGVYWLDLFGGPYRELIGDRVLGTAPAAVVDEDEHRIVLRAFAAPEEWREAGEAKARLRRHLGTDVFFDRSRPDRPTRAPAFGLDPLPARPPLQVVTPDGEHVTPLPRLDG